MKKLVILANCQGVALAKTLFENSEFSSTYSWVRIKPIQALTDKDVAEVVAKVEQADLFIYQPVSATPTRPDALSSAFLLKKVNPKALSLSIPSIYFDGYFPHLKTLKGRVSVLNLVHDYVVAYACVLGLSVEKTLELIQKEDFYPQKLSLALANKSLTELKKREEESAIDMPLSGFIEKNYQQVKLFNQFNHPKRIVFKYLAEGILDRCGISSPLISDVGDAHLDAIESPIYRSTYKHLNLQFTEDFDVYRGVAELESSQQAVVSAFFDFYRQQNLAFIKGHVAKTKPFVPELIESHL